MSDLVSSVPGVYAALLGLIETAGAAQSPVVPVYAFELALRVPSSYITVHEIAGPAYEWESIGTFSQKELYDISGSVVVFTGDSPANRPTVATDVLSQTLSLFQSCVMTPTVTNRNMPILGTTGPSPYLMLPKEMGYDAHAAAIGNEPGGWVGVYSWSFHFEALLTPA